MKGRDYRTAPKRILGIGRLVGKRVRIIGHLYCTLLWDEPISKALRYSPY